jgi:dihydroorotate dehydrogenase
VYYYLLKKLLFRMEPEKAHRVSLLSLRYAHKIGFTKLYPPIPALPRQVMGLHFPNPVGLAAGMDKNGDYIEGLASLGFGFIEVGTVTPKPQDGNPAPRVFRLPEHLAIINRMGFNSKGCDYLVSRLKKSNYQGVLGINIGKNRETPVENAVEDYLYSFRRVAPYASYVAINVSSPNTEGLRDLQHGDMLQSLVRALKHEQQVVLEFQNKYVPLVVKLAPDLAAEELHNIAEILLAEKIDAVIATNTTLSREGVEDSPFAKEEGGLSGRPLCKRSTAAIKQLQTVFKDHIPIIATGGILCEKSAFEKISAGASLVQLYSGLIFNGPAFVRDVLWMVLRENVDPSTRYRHSVS